jgi:hypothetical protein
MSSYIDPAIRDKYDSLTDDLKKAIDAMDVKIYTLNDLIKCLEKLAGE